MGINPINLINDITHIFMHTQSFTHMQDHTHTHTHTHARTHARTHTSPQEAAREASPATPASKMTEHVSSQQSMAALAQCASAYK